MNSKVKNIIVCSIGIVCLIFFVIIFNSILKTGGWEYDASIYGYVSSFSSSILTYICMGLAKIGGRGGTAIISILFCVISIVKYKNKKMALVFLLNVFIVGLMNHIIKEFVKRPRPDYRMMDVSGFSFPSGHSMISIALWGFVIILIYKYIKNIRIKWCCIAGLSVFIVLMGLSRIYLGVHYPSDVIAGFLLGIIHLIVYEKISSVLLKKNSL